MDRVVAAAVSALTPTPTDSRIATRPGPVGQTIPNRWGFFDMLGNL
jgi:hypothetical protein